MKNAITPSIKSACTAKWETFATAPQGRFCHDCQKPVADLTYMSDRQLLEYLRSRTSSTCARMRNDQLKSYPLPGPPAKHGFGLLKAAAASLLLLILNRQVYAQTKDGNKTEIIKTAEKKDHELTQERLIRVSGQVVDELGQPMPGISIVLQGTNIGTSADITGRFALPDRIRAGQCLLFSFVGYATKEYKVKATTSDEIEIEMKMDEMELMGELVIDKPYTIQTMSLWSKIRNLF